MLNEKLERSEVKYILVHIPGWSYCGYQKFRVYLIHKFNNAIERKVELTSAVVDMFNKVLSVENLQDFMKGERLYTMHDPFQNEEWGLVESGESFTEEDFVEQLQKVFPTHYKVEIKKGKS